MTTKLKNIIVFHVCTKGFPVLKYDAIIEKFKENMKEVLNALPQNTKAIFLPQEHDTYIEIIELK